MNTINQEFLSGIQQVIPQEDFLTKLTSGKKLVIKFGADPTAPDLHLGHAVVLSKLRQFQDAGHTIIFLIGDFTARIGDPTGRSKTRPSLSSDDIAHNTKTYFDQVSRILDPKKITIRYNSEWLDKLSSKDLISLCSKATLAKIIDREDFANRFEQKIPIGLHELLYPLLQGYDSVMLKADVELGGTDQTFNLLMGRFLQEQYHQEPQVVITLPLLPGTDGVAKMSKSLGNAISLSDTAQDAFGKLMSISDKLILTYKTLLLPIGSQTQNAEHPMALKKQIAHDIIARFWSLEDAHHAQQVFEELFQKKNYSFGEPISLASLSASSLDIIELLKQLKAVSSSAEARRLLDAGAISVDDEKITGFKTVITLTVNTCIKVGKHRIYKIVA